MKNLKMSRKITVAFGVVIACYIFTVAFMTLGINTTRGNYQTFYENTHTAVTKAITIRVNLQKSIKDVSFALLEPDATSTQTYLKEADEIGALVESDLAWFNTEYDGDTTLVKQFESAYQNISKLQAQLKQLATDGSEEALAQAEEILVTDFGPAANEAANVLLTFSDGLTANAESVYNNGMKVNTIIVVISVVITVVAIAITIGMALALIRSIVLPIKEMEEAMVEMQNGSVNVKLEYSARDEIGQLADGMRKMMVFLKNIITDESQIFTRMGDGDFTVHSGIADQYVGDYSEILTAMRKLRDNLSSTLTQINAAADQVAAGSDQVSSGSQALAQGATEQASSVEELAATTNEISEKVSTNAESAKQANEKAITVKENADKSRQRMQDMLTAMTDISTKSGEVGKIIKTIEDIAFQTNILALNAAVEAARAGDAGKGFAVVADEVRNLAGKSAEASTNTSALIEESIQAVERGIRIANETAQSLDEVVDGVDDVSTTIELITEASEEQASALAQVNQGVDQISSVVQTNSATAEQSAAASEELSEQSQVLKRLVSNFKLSDQGGIPAAAPAPSYDPQPVDSYSDMGMMDSSYSVGSDFGNDKY